MKPLTPEDDESVASKTIFATLEREKPSGGLEFRVGTPSSDSIQRREQTTEKSPNPKHEKTKQHAQKEIPINERSEGQKETLNPHPTKLQSTEKDQEPRRKARPTWKKQ